MLQIHKRKSRIELDVAYQSNSSISNKYPNTELIVQWFAEPTLPDDASGFHHVPQSLQSQENKNISSSSSMETGR